MKTKKIMTELDNLCEFVLKSGSIYDFHIRFNFLLSMAVNSFEDEISKRNHLPFNSYIFIETLNNKINSIIEKINRSKIFYNDGELMSDIFMIILKEDFPEYYKNYLYQVEYINN
jgi:hypothetical protein